MTNLKLGSLFDGSGGFPLGGVLAGIEPVWASEVEPFPIAVTRSRFPGMKHLGSVTDVKGNEVEPVDVITFGSPCQDLSVAGKRAGLKHTENGDDETTRSGLFMEAVRIIKEMRKATNGEYPRYAVWENVPGAFSSNKGLDFRVVLEELIRIAEPTAVMPDVPKAGWAYADVYCGNGWSLAYRVLDAQYFGKTIRDGDSGSVLTRGTPQRRRRIYLVADFRGQRAGKILFEPKGLRGHLATSGTQREATAGDAQSGVGADDREGKCVNVLNPWDSQGNQVHDGTGDNVYPTLRGCGGAGYQAGYVLAEAENVAQAYGISSYASNAMMSSNPHSGIYEADTARTLDLNGGNPACNQGGIAIVEPVGCDLYNLSVSGDVAVSLTTAWNATGSGPTVAVPYTLKIRGGVEVDSAGKAVGKGALIQTNLSATLGTSQDQYLFQPILDDQGGSQISVRYDGKSPTLRAEMHGNVPAVMEPIAVATQQGGAEITENGICPTITAAAGMSGNNQPWICKPVSIENHPADSRVNIDESGKVQTLTSRMGTGGGNVPMVMEPVAFAQNQRDEVRDLGGKAGALQAEPGMKQQTFVAQPTYCIEGNGSRPSHQGDGYSESDKMYTLNTIERHAVCYSETYQKVTGPLMANSHPGSYSGQDAYNDMFVVGKEMPICVADHVTPKIDEDGVAFTLNARDYKDPQAVAYEQPIAIDRAFFNQGQNAQYDPQYYTDGTGATSDESGNSAVAVRYIVRRLTPTECARLQGFPDAWAHPDAKTELTDEEYRFWCDVYLTKALIDETVVPNEDGVLCFKSRMKPFTHKTKDQMLTWYNKLHTDSAEYKLWGNGIALPCALYVMEGIANEN